MHDVVQHIESGAPQPCLRIFARARRSARSTRTARTCPTISARPKVRRRGLSATRPGVWFMGSRRAPGSRYAAVQGHGGAQCFSVAHDDDAAVVTDVGPFVRVGGPGVRLLEPARQMAVLWRSVRPQTECAVYVNPCALFLRARTNLARLDRRLRCSRFLLGGKRWCGR